VGAAIYFAIVTLTGYETGLVAIAVGFLVGAGVRMGSHGKGGMPYQALALAVTYFVVVTYVPFIIEGMFVPLEVAPEEMAKVIVRSDDSIVLNGSPVTVEEAVTGLERFSESGVVWYYQEQSDQEEICAAAVSVFAAITKQNLYVYLFHDPGFTEPENFWRDMQRRDLQGRGTIWAFVFATAVAAPFYDLPGNIIGLAIIGFALFQAWKMNRRERIALTGPFEISQLAGARVSSSSALRD